MFPNSAFVYCAAQVKQKRCGDVVLEQVVMFPSSHSVKQHRLLLEIDT